MANAPEVTVCLAGNAGRYKSNLSIGQLFLRGVMAGAYIAIGAALCTVVGTGVAPHLGAGAARLLSAAVFPVGLIAIILTGMELFTGDAMLGPLAVLQGKVGWAKVLKNWFWVYLGNLVGSLVYAYIMVYGPFTQGSFAGGALNAVEPNAFGLNAVSIAVSKTLTYKAVGGMGMWSCFLSAIGCNFLVNVAVLLAITAKDFIGKFFGIWFPIMAFVATGFEHCVANMYFLPAGLWLTQLFPGVIDKITVTADGTVTYAFPLLHQFGGLSWGDVWLWNLLPVTLGNIVGGMFFVGFVYYFAFRSEFPEDLLK